MNPVQLYRLSLASKNSRAQVDKLTKRIAALENINNVESYPWHEMTYSKTLSIMTELEEKLAYTSVNAYLAVIKGVSKQCWMLGLMDGDTYSKIKAVQGRKGSRVPSGRAISDLEADALFTVCTNDPNIARSKRNAAILALGLFAGLRRSEIAQLKRHDIDLYNASYTVIGKGNKQQTLPLAATALPHLTAWLEECLRQNIKGDYLFGEIEKNGNIKHLNGIIGNTVWTIIKKTAFDAGVDPDRLPSPHDMRRTLITNLLDKGINPRITQVVARHANVQTTMRYDRGDIEDAVRNAIDS
jgi:integrase